MCVLSTSPTLDEGSTFKTKYKIEWQNRMQNVTIENGAVLSTKAPTE